MYTVEHIELPPIRVAGLMTRARNDNTEAISQHWNRFLADRTVAGIANGGVLSVYSDYESDYTGEYSLLLGYKIVNGAEPPAGLHVMEIPAQKYGVVLAQGEQPTAVRSAWQWVWASALRRTYGTDFDEYISPFDVRVHVAIA